MSVRPTTRRRTLAAGLLVIAGAAGAAGLAIGSDHQDTRRSRAEPQAGHDGRLRVPRLRARPHRAGHEQPGVPHAGRRPPPMPRSTPTCSTSSRSTTAHADAREDKVIQVTFSGTGADQQVEVRGPVAPPVQGATDNEIADVSPAVTGAINTPAGQQRRHPGVRRRHGTIRSSSTSRPLFCILPDRRPEGGPLSGRTAARCTPNPAAPFYFRNPGVNYVDGLQRALDRRRAAELADRERRAGQAGHLGHHQPMTPTIAHTMETSHAAHHPRAPSPPHDAGRRRRGARPRRGGVQRRQRPQHAPDASTRSSGWAIRSSARCC